MRLISALLCFCLTFNVMAASGTVQELERAVDEYQYALTVEWDQKDSTFMTAKSETFFAKISDLMDQGLTKNEVMNLVAKKTKNPKDLEALKLKMELLATGANTSDELARAISQDSKNLYATGASWEGKYTAISVGFVVILGAALAYSIWFENNKVCVDKTETQSCGYVSRYANQPDELECITMTDCHRYEDK